jgi:hypothetical protein
MSCQHENAVAAFMDEKFEERKAMEVKMADGEDKEGSSSYICLYIVYIFLKIYCCESKLWVYIHHICA